MEVKSRSREGTPPMRAAAHTGPRDVDASFPATLPELVRWAASRHGERVFLPRRNSRGGGPVSFARLAEDVTRVAEGLAACGIGHGDRVALIAENCYEWLAVDLGTVFLGAIDVPRGIDTAPSELEQILSHSGSRFVFVEDDRTAREIRQQDLPAVERICTLADSTDVPGVMTLPQLLAQGEEWSAARPDALDEMVARVSPEDVLTIVYTSGTTSDPKGVMLSHANVLSNVRICGRILGFNADDTVLSLLPAWHMYERMMNYVALACGATLVYTDRRRFKKDLLEVRPTTFAAVPRVWEMVYDGIVAKLRKLKGPRRQVMQLVLRTCRRVGSGRCGPVHRVLHRAFRATVLPRIHQATGGRLRLAVSGGGALAAHVDECLLGLGFPLLNGYGLTETSPVASVRLPHDNRAGTIGPPIPETAIEVRGEDGRPLSPGETGILWIRGPQVMKGYYKNAARTADVLDDAGWFNTGDLGQLEPNGHVRITGRAKDTIVLAGGENIEPEPIEAAIKTSELVEQVVVVGQDRKQLGAVIVPAVEELEDAVPSPEWDRHDGELRGRAVRELYRRELDTILSRANGFRAVEQIGPFAVVIEPMSIENGMLTPTMKVKRRVVHERLAHVIAAMYG